MRLRTAAGLAAIAAVAAVAAAAGTAAMQGDSATTTTTTTTMTTTGPVAVTAPPPAPGPGVLLVWTTGSLPPAALAAAAAAPGVDAVAVVRSGRADLVASTGADGTPVDDVADGFVIPLDVAAVDPATYAEVVPAADRAAVAALGPGEAILGETSAALRELGPGGRLQLAGGTTLAVVAVVPDTSVGAAEVVVDAATGAALGVDTPRAALIAHDGDRAAIEAGVAGAAAGTPLRFRAPGETPYLRAADAVLPQAVVKAAFGEFAYRPGRGADAVVPDPEWVAAAIVDAEVPVLGTVRCHRAIVEPLRRAMAAIEAEGLGDELAAAGFDGCFVPRFLRGGSTLSRHTWGIALDVGFGANPTNATPAQHERVVELLAEEGFTWGGTWLELDPAHFEMVRLR